MLLQDQVTTADMLSYLLLYRAYLLQYCAIRAALRMCGRWSESATSSWARDQDPDLNVTLEFYIKTVRLLARLLQNVTVSLPF